LPTTIVSFQFRRVLPGFRVDLLPEKPEKKQKYESDYLKKAQEQLTTYLEYLNSFRTTIFAFEAAASQFCKFLAPLQMGDKKPQMYRIINYNNFNRLFQFAISSGFVPDIVNQQITFKLYLYNVKNFHYFFIRDLYRCDK
jgi:hypothetical protein